MNILKHSFVFEAAMRLSTLLGVSGKVIGPESIVWKGDHLAGVYLLTYFSDKKSFTVSVETYCGDDLSIAEAIEKMFSISVIVVISDSKIPDDDSAITKSVKAFYKAIDFDAKQELKNGKFKVLTNCGFLNVQTDLDCVSGDRFFHKISDEGKSVGTCVVPQNEPLHGVYFQILDLLLPGTPRSASKYFTYVPIDYNLSGNACLAYANIEDSECEYRTIGGKPYTEIKLVFDCGTKISCRGDFKFHLLGLPYPITSDLLKNSFTVMKPWFYGDFSLPDFNTEAIATTVWTVKTVSEQLNRVVFDNGLIVDFSNCQRQDTFTTLHGKKIAHTKLSGGMQILVNTTFFKEDGVITDIVKTPNFGTMSVTLSGGRFLNFTKNFLVKMCDSETRVSANLLRVGMAISE